jgi:4-amino-4-deoxy-L-arabinose transferase-like glycosyltransferase
VQTKGLLGLCPLAANVVFWLLTRRESTSRLKRFLNWPMIFVGVVLALFWYALMLHRHGVSALKDFYSDQIGAKVSTQPGFVLGNFFSYLLAGFQYFLPWSAMAVIVCIVARRQLANFWKQHRKECLFLILLYAFLLIVFSLGNMRRPRYLGASYPMLSVLLAGALVSVGPHLALERLLNCGVRIVASLVLLLGTALFVLQIGADWRLLAGSIALIALGILGVLMTRRSSDMGLWQIWITGATITAFVVIGAFVRPVFATSPLPVVAQNIRQLNSTVTNIIVVWQLPDAAASQLRVSTGGKIEIQYLDEKKEPDLNRVTIAITSASNQMYFAKTGFNVREITAPEPKLPNSFFGRLENNASVKARKHAITSCWLVTRSP